MDPRAPGRRRRAVRPQAVARRPPHRAAAQLQLRLLRARRADRAALAADRRLVPRPARRRRPGRTPARRRRARRLSGLGRAGAALRDQRRGLLRRRPLPAADPRAAGDRRRRRRHVDDRARCARAAGSMRRSPWRLLGIAATATLWPLALDDGRLEERVAMASALAGLGRPAEAMARAAAIAREHPEPGTVHYRVALALQAHGDLASAEAEVRRALSIDPKQPEAHAVARPAARPRRPRRRGAPSHAARGGRRRQRRGCRALDRRRRDRWTRRRRARCSRWRRWRGRRRRTPPRCATSASICSRRVAAIWPSPTSWPSTRGIRAAPTSSRRSASRCWSAADRRGRRGRSSAPSASTATARAATCTWRSPTSRSIAASEALAEARRALALRPDYPQARGVVEALTGAR